MTDTKPLICTISTTDSLPKPSRMAGKSSFNLAVVLLTAANSQYLVEKEGFPRAIWANDNNRSKGPFQLSDDVQSLSL